MNHTAEWQEGWAAANAGKKLSDCPYELEEFSKAVDWFEGFYDRLSSDEPLTTIWSKNL